MMKVSAARILVVDDELAVVELLVSLLEEEGYEVSSAVTSDEGLKLFTLSRPDLVLLDIALPGISGLEMFRRIRSLDPTARVVMVSGVADPVRAREALELGALAYVDKPFDFAYLKRVVAMALHDKSA